MRAVFSLLSVLVFAAMVSGCQKSTEEKLDAIDKKLDAINKRFDANDKKLDAIDKRFDAIDKKLDVLQKKMDVLSLRTGTPVFSDQVNKQIARAKVRVSQDSKLYSPEELRKIESLYQIFNKKDWTYTEAKKSVEELLLSYPKANRTGCALLCLGQSSIDGKDKIAYLRKAIDDYGDCFYGNGVQVGAYARYSLASYFALNGENESAKKLLVELNANYPDAVSYGGRSLAPDIDSLSEQLLKQSSASAQTAPH